MTNILTLVCAIDENPTLEQVDAMLVELVILPKDKVVAGLIDDLLDYRAMLTA